VGEPFWAIMELDEQGELTGSYFCSESPSDGKVVPLFYSRAHAEQMMRDFNLDARGWSVRGLRRDVFRVFVMLLDLFVDRGGARPMVMFRPPGAGSDEKFMGFPAECEAMISEYYGGDTRSMRRKRDTPAP
jgi:hypothetical protein